MTTIETVRRRLWLYLSPDVAADAGLTFDELKMFINGTRTPPPDKLAKLARRMGLS